MTGTQVVRLLQERGWIVARVRGSHYIMYRNGYRPVAVPVHGKKDLGPGLLKAICRQTDLEVDG